VRLSCHEGNPDWTSAALCLSQTHGWAAMSKVRSKEKLSSFDE
jgi:hypothetical protein